MHVLLTSIVRNGAGYLDRYIKQTDALREQLHAMAWPLTVAVCEGDSTDHTDALLLEYAHTRNLHVYNYNHGGPAFGSVDNAVRWRNIARTWNYLFNQIAEIHFHALIYVEADLVWQPHTMIRLLRHLDKVPAVAPMSMLGHAFYDTWGYRACGRHFTAWPPYHPGLIDNRGELFRIESAGSCKVMRGEIARQCRFSETDAMLGHDIYAKGYSLWLDPTVSVHHA